MFRRLQKSCEWMISLEICGDELKFEIFVPSTDFNPSCMVPLYVFTIILFNVIRYAFLRDKT